MQAIIHDTFGDPEAVLHVEERPTPEPRAGEVRVRTTLASIHNHDLWTVRGSYGFKPHLPSLAGTEAVGIVDAIGDGVTAVAVGQRVATGGTFGVWAEYFVMPAASAIRVPDDMPDETAAQMVSMPFSVMSLLHSLDLHDGDWLIQNASNGAVGRMIAQLGTARRLNVVGLVRRAAGIAELESQGIGNIVSTDSDDWRDRVREITGGASVVAGIDSVGGTASGDVLSVLAENGVLVAFGAMESPVMKISSADVIFKQATVRGFWASTVGASMDPALRGALFGEMIEHILRQKLTLPVAATFRFADIADAVRASGTAGRIGKVLLAP